MEKILNNVFEKCELLLLSETEDEAVKIDDEGIIEKDRESYWSAWQPTPIQKRLKLEISEEDTLKETIERIQSEIF